MTSIITRRGLTAGLFLALSSSPVVVGKTFPPNCDPQTGPIGTTCEENAGSCNYGFIWVPTYLDELDQVCSEPLTCSPTTTTICSGGVWGPTVSQAMIGCENRRARRLIQELY